MAKQDFDLMARLGPVYAAVGISAVGISLIGLIGWVLFLLWVYQAHANLRRAGIIDTHYSARWAVGSYFVPVANLFVPMLAMRELWNRSHGENVYQAESAVGEVTNWWTCMIVALGLTSYLGIVTVINLTTPYKILSSAGANGVLVSFASLLMLGGIWFQFVIVGRISVAQRSMVDAASVFG